MHKGSLLYRIGKIQRHRLRNVADGVFIAPTVAGISINESPLYGGEVIIASGLNFANGINVSIGGVAVNNLIRHSDSEIEFVAPVNTWGVKDIVVTNPGPGDLSHTLSSSFRYYYENLFNASNSLDDAALDKTYINDMVMADDSLETNKFGGYALKWPGSSASHGDIRVKDTVVTSNNYIVELDSYAETNVNNFERTMYVCGRMNLQPFFDSVWNVVSKNGASQDLMELRKVVGGSFSVIVDTDISPLEYDAHIYRQQIIFNGSTVTANLWRLVDGEPVFVATSSGSLGGGNATGLAGIFNHTIGNGDSWARRLRVYPLWP